MTILKNNRNRALLLATISLSVFLTFFTFAPRAQAIWGGSVTNPPFAPVGAVKLYSLTVCTGTLIAPQFVLTAAHCLAGDNFAWGFPSGPSFTILPRETVLSYMSFWIVDTFGIPYIKFPMTDFRVLGTNLGHSDLAVLKLSSPVLSFYATPVPISRQVLSRGTQVKAIGFGQTCWICNDGGGPQRGVSYPLEQFNPGCHGDSGGPKLWNGQIYSVTSAGSGLCGLQGDFHDYDADPGRHYNEILEAIAQMDGPPICTASVSPSTGYLTTKFKSHLLSYGADTCSYSLDGGPLWPCEHPDVPPEFLGSNIGAAQHSLVFRISNPAGSYTCPTNTFRVYAPSGSAEATVTGDSRVNTGSSGTFHAGESGFFWGTRNTWTATYQGP